MPTMQKAHFELIAQSTLCTKSSNPFPEGTKLYLAYNNALNDAARDLAFILATTNPLFNRARFLAACGASPEGLSLGLRPNLKSQNKSTPKHFSS